MFKHISRDKSFYIKVLALSWPTVVQNMVNQSMVMLDSFMVGGLGERYLSAVTLANTVFFVVSLVLFGLQSGCSVLIAQYFGKNDKTTVNRVMGIGLGVSLSVSILVALAVIAFPMRIYSLTSNDAELVSIAADYGRVAAFSMVLNAASMIYISAQRSMENPRLGMAVLITSVAANTFLNWVFIYGNLGAPAMGVEGAALATLLSRCLEFVLTFGYALFNKKFKLEFAAMIKPGKMIFKDFIRFSLPVVINEAAWGFGFSLYSIIFGHMENAVAAVAAYTITLNVERLLSALYFGVGQAAAVLVGKELGAGRREAAYSNGLTILVLTAGFGLLAAVLMIILNYSVILPFVFPLFGASALTVEIGGTILLIMALTLPFRAVNFCIIVGILRGGGDVRIGVLIDVACMYGIGIPFSAAAGLMFNAPAALVFMMMSMEEFIKILPCLLRFNRKLWLRDVTR